MTTTSSIPEAAIAAATEMPRLEDGYINLQEAPRRLAESVVNGVTDAEADQLCEATSNNRERMLATCVGTLTPGLPKLRSDSFFPEDVPERHRRVDRAVVAAVAETCATGTSTRKVQRVAAPMGIERISRDRPAPYAPASTPRSRSSPPSRPATCPRPTCGSTRPT